MDLEAFSEVHRPKWRRLKYLASRRKLAGSEADEFFYLYQLASSHLSTISSVSSQSPISQELSQILSSSRMKFTGARSNFSEDFTRFFLIALPLAFYRTRQLTLIIAAIFIVFAFIQGYWVATNSEVQLALGPPSALKKYAEESFTSYYSENPAASFAGAVWTNNAFIAAQCVAFGVTGIFVPFILHQNALSIGQAGGIMFAYERGDVFFSYIVPHGLMEMTCVFISAAAGLKIFWSWVAPGRKTRAQSLAQEARSLITVALGLVLLLFVSGIVEGFVTPSTLPVWLKITIGALVLAGYWTYTMYFGSKADKAGESSDLWEHDRAQMSIDV